MGIQRLKNAAEAAGYAMAVPVEYDEESQNFLKLEQPLAERPTYVPHKPEQKVSQSRALVLVEQGRATDWFSNWVGLWRGGRAVA